ncbi:MAG TPA: hypothetical protein VE863_12600, partial [Pyrinomonadaceae bacterium]|nr:hypothetical protein [Pyrinomonadaceae bacterium]
MRSNNRLSKIHTYLFIVLCLTTAVVASVATLRKTRAASPASGTLATTGPVAPFTGTWTGTATGGSSPNGESTCVEGTNCDTFRLTVAPGDYTGKQISIKISWGIPANDYDLYIHKCPTTASTIAQCNAGPTAAQGENGGAPGTSDGAAIDPGGVVAAATDYTVHVVYFTVAPDQYQASATLESKTTATRAATYITGGMSFSPSVAVKAPVANRDGEPSNRTDVQGNHYSVGIRGFPAGVDLWYNDLRPTVNNAANPNFDAYLRNYIYRGQPDSFSPSSQADLGGDGGGDVDLAVSMPDPTNGTVPNPPTLAGSSLIAANISTFRSADIGQTFTKNNLGNCSGGACADDRQWEEFFGNSVVYLFYRTLEPAVSQVQRSTDGGL